MRLQKIKPPVGARAFAKATQRIVLVWLVKIEMVNERMKQRLSVALQPRAVFRRDAGLNKVTPHIYPSLPNHSDWGTRHWYPKLYAEFPYSMYE